MKPLASLFLIFVFTFNSFGAWKNGPKTTDINQPFFGGHDWVAWKAVGLAEADGADVSFINDNLMIYFSGTEAPDNGLLPGVGAAGRYADKRQCHCILFDVRGNVTKDRAAQRALEEFTKAKAALRSGDKRLAAYYAGAMSHYIADLGQFMHMMGTGAHWGEDDSSSHGAYEGVMDAKLDIRERESTFLEEFIESKEIAGSNAREITISVARFVETGGGSEQTVGWMYEEYVSYRAVFGKRTKPERWSGEFRDQTGANVNEAVNGIAKLLVMLAE